MLQSGIGPVKRCDTGDGGPYGPRWFALRVKSGHEKLVATIAHNKGFQEFLPLYRSRRRWSDRIKAVEAPLFPGYIFCRLHPERRLPLLTVPGAMHFVGIGKVPEPIEDIEIDNIQRALRTGLLAEPWPFLKVGQHVRLVDGPLAGLEGLLIKVRNQHRLVVSVSLLRRSVGVEIDGQWAEPMQKFPLTDAARPSQERAAGLPGIPS